MSFSALPRVPLVGRILMITADHRKEERLREFNSIELNVEVESEVSTALNRALEGGFVAALVDLTEARPPLDSIQLFHDFLPALPVITIVPFENSSLALSALQAGAQDCLYPNELTTAILSRKIAYATERCRLFESQGRFAEVVAMNVDGIVVVDNDGVVLYVNPVAERLFKIRAEELRGRLFGFRIKENESTEIDIVVEGSRSRVAELRASQIDWGGHVAFLVSVRDITQRKDAERRAREQAELMRGILQSMSAHIAVLDSSGTIRAVNSAWEDFAKKHGAGKTSEYGVGQNYLKVCREAKGSDSGIAQKVYEGLSRVLNGEIPSFKYEYSIDVHTQKLWFVMQATSLTGEQHGAVVSHFDITDQKVAEYEHRRK